MCDHADTRDVPQLQNRSSMNLIILCCISGDYSMKLLRYCLLTKKW